jgi:hypothetical protein
MRRIVRGYADRSRRVCHLPAGGEPRAKASRVFRTLLLTSVLGTFLSVVGCGGSGAPDGDQPSTRDSTIAAVSSQAPNERCPPSLPPGRAAAKGILRAVPREIRRAYHDIDRRDNQLYALFALDYREVAPGLRRSRYVQVAARACGRETANRSWVAILSFPRAPFASFVPAVTFFARTESGWRIWYLWHPNMRESGFPP